MPKLTESDLKIRGAAAIETALAKQSAVIISVRGQDRFAVMDLADYHHLRECDLGAAVAQSQNDRATGRAVIESAQAHVARMNAILAADASAEVKPRKR